MATSLVSYDSSDDSSNEEKEDSNNANRIKEIVGQEMTACTELKQENENLQISNSLAHAEYKKTCQSNKKVENETFPRLPKAKCHDTDIDWNHLKILKDSQSGTIKISVPSLSEVEDYHTLEPEKKKLKPSQKGCGLFALLPSPKKQDKLIPQVATRKNNCNSCYMSINSYRNMNSKESVCTVSDNVESEGLNFAKSNDFFSLCSSENNSVSTRKIPGDFSDNTSEFLRNLYEDKEISNVQTRESLIITDSFQQESLYPTAVHEKVPLHPVAAASFIPVESNVKLNDIALHQLCGKRDRHKLKSESVELIEISGDSIIPDSHEWLTKQLTEENQYTTANGHKKKDGPTSQQKRKHQITYLAFQAKEHELELKNQWANNRMSRKQTQAKYGF